MLGLLGTTLAVASGCTAAGSFGSGEPSDDRNAPESDAQSFEVLLSGPGQKQPLFDAGDVTEVGEVQKRNGACHLPVELTDDATTTVRETFRSSGVDDDPEAFEIVHRKDGEELNRLGIAPPLAEAIADGTWDGSFVLAASDRDRAEELRETLKSVEAA